MTIRRGMGILLLMASGLVCVNAQSTRNGGQGAGADQSRARFFQITLLLRFSGAGSTEERTQLITTDVAVMGDRPGSGKARVISQTPYTTSKGTNYVDIGTKLDCNEIHLDGQALTMAVVLETNQVTGMVTTTDGGRSLEEPVISQRNLSQQIRLPLGVSTVIFDAKNVDMLPVKPLKNDAAEAAQRMRPSPGVAGSLTQVEMTAREL